MVIRLIHCEVKEWPKCIHHKWIVVVGTILVRTANICDISQQVLGEAPRVIPYVAT